MVEKKAVLLVDEMVAMKVVAMDDWLVVVWEAV